MWSGPTIKVKFSNLKSGPPLYTEPRIATDYCYIMDCMYKEVDGWVGVGVGGSGAGRWSAKGRLYVPSNMTVWSIYESNKY